MPFALGLGGSKDPCVFGEIRVKTQLDLPRSKTALCLRSRPSLNARGFNSVFHEPDFYYPAWRRAWSLTAIRRGALRFRVILAQPLTASIRTAYRLSRISSGGCARLTRHLDLPNRRAFRPASTF